MSLSGSCQGQGRVTCTQWESWLEFNLQTRDWKITEHSETSMFFAHSLSLLLRALSRLTSRELENFIQFQTTLLSTYQVSSIVPLEPVPRAQRWVKRCRSREGVARPSWAGAQLFMVGWLRAIFFFFIGLITTAVKQESGHGSASLSGCNQGAAILGWGLTGWGWGGICSQVHTTVLGRIWVLAVVGLRASVPCWLVFLGHCHAGFTERQVPAWHLPFIWASQQKSKRWRTRRKPEPSGT